MKKPKITELLIFIVATELVGALSGLLAGNSFSFYKELIKPPLSPPGWLFPVMWAILYALMGISAFIIYTSNAKEKCPAFIIYGTQLFVKFHVEHCIFQIQNVKTFCCSNSDFAGVNYCNDYYIPQNSSVSRLSEYPVFAVDIICFVS